MPEEVNVAVPVAEGGGSVGFVSSGEATSVPPVGVTPPPAPGAPPGNAPTPVPPPFELPSDLKGEASLTGFKSVEALARAFVETKKLVGKSIQLKDGQPDETVYVKLGRPADPAGYKFTKPDFGLKEIYLPDGFEESTRNLAFQLGLNQKQFDELVNRRTGELETGYRTVEESMQEWDKALKYEWGANTERNVAIAARAVAHYDKDGKFRQALNSSGLGDHPSVIKAFYDLGKKLQEDGIIVGEVAGLTNKEAAKTRIAEIRSNPELLDQSSPKGKLLREELEKLYQLVYNA